MPKGKAKPALILTALPFRWLADSHEYVMSGKGAEHEIVNLRSLRRRMAPLSTRRYVKFTLEPFVEGLVPRPGLRSLIAIEALLAGNLAFLRVWDQLADDGPGQCVRREAKVRGEELCPFPVDQLPGGVLEVHPSWTVTRGEALLALEFFVQHGDCDPALPWVEVEDWELLERV